MDNDVFVFGPALIGEIVAPVKYTIGVDTYDKNFPTYCLCRLKGETVEVLLSKTMRDEKEFEREVQDLAKYFNADISRSGE